MDGLPYLAAVAGSVVAVFVVRQMCRRFDVAGRRGLQALFAIIAGVAGIIAYFLVAPVFGFVRPDRGYEIGASFGAAARVSAVIILAAVTFSLRHYARAKVPPPAKSTASVREQLLTARQTIQRRIQYLQSNPQNYHRGGVPQTDVIVNELMERLAEIDHALAESEPGDSK